MTDNQHLTPADRQLLAREDALDKFSGRYNFDRRADWVHRLGRSDGVRGPHHPDDPAHTEDCYAIGRLNWNSRHGPDEFDDTAPSEVSYAFDLHRDARPGAPSSWPERVNGVKFGPTFIKKAWQAGLVVIAEIEGYPHPVAAQEVRWGASGVLEVGVQGSWKIPSRLFTRSSVKGLMSTGEFIEEKR